MNSSGIPFGHTASHSPWFEQPPNASRRMAATIDRALSVRAADRPRSIEELRSRLWGEDAGEDGRSGDDEDRAPARLPEASVTLPLLIDIELRSDGHLRHIDRLSLAEAGHYVIGSLPENEIQLVGGQICDEHACLVVRERDLEIINLNNEYGTYIGETSIDRAPWDGREPIRIGSYEIRFVKSA